MPEIDYGKLIDKHPWIVEKGHRIVLSPDSDGFLCGLLMSNRLDSKVSGYYDDKLLILEAGVEPEDCLFIDHDINRPTIRSIGHHMVRYNKNLTRAPNFNYDSCIQPNNIRNFDAKHDFQRKYPLGTIHLLLGVYQEAGLSPSLPRDSTWPLLFVDGVFNNLFGYPENCIDWIKYLRIDVPKHILYQTFCAHDRYIYETMTGLEKFFAMRDRYNMKGIYNGSTYVQGGRGKRTGHQLKISNTNGAPINLVATGKTYGIHPEEKQRVSGFITEMGQMIGLKYLPAYWRWDQFAMHIFKKKIETELTQTKYIDILSENPLSLAMTGTTTIQYTIE